jgi:hypothetical protein
MRLNQRHQRRPRHQTIKLAQKYLTARRLASPCVFAIGKTALTFHQISQCGINDLRILYMVD